MFSSSNFEQIGSFKIVKCYVVEDLTVFVLDINANRQNANLSLIPLEQQIQIGRYHFEIDRSRRLIARSFLYTYLSTKYGSFDFLLGLNEFGRPYLLDNRRVSFNFSYSDRYIAIAVAKDRTVGIDIEVPNLQSDIGEVSQYIMEATELGVLGTLTNNRDKFNYCIKTFCSKEAIVKALGVGLYHDPATIVAKYDQPFNLSAKRFILRCLEESNQDYYLSLCYEAEHQLS